MPLHATGYTVKAAVELARALKYGPLPSPSDSPPTHIEAMSLIEEERHVCGFNWLTGEVAQSVIKAYLEGAEVSAGGVCPYPDWSDECRAWMEGRSAGS